MRSGSPSPAIPTPVPGRPELAPPGGARGTPLGLPFFAAGRSRASWGFTLAPGETVVLFTDGVYEARRGEEFFGEDRLRAVIDDAAGGGQAQVVADRVLAAVRSFTGGDTLDDMAVLVIAYVGPSLEQATEAERDSETCTADGPDVLRVPAGPLA